MVGKPKGLPKTGGRKKGSTNRKTIEVLENCAKEGITPLEYMLQVLRNEGNPTDVRLDAAKSAAPYIHRKQPSIVEGSGDDNAAIVVHTTVLTATEAKIIADAIEEEY